MKKIKYNKFGKFLSFLLMIFTIACIGMVIYIGVLPFKPLVISIVILIGIVFSIICLQFVKKKSNKKLNGITFLCTLIMGIVCVYFMNTLNFFNFVTKSEFKTQNYCVIVLNTSQYNKIRDLSGKKLGYIENDDEGTKLALENIVKEVTTCQISKDNAISMSEGLFSGELQAIMLENTYKEILSEEVKDFSNKTKVIYEFSVKVKSNEMSKKVSSITKESFNIYISGIDTYGDISSVSRSDVNIVVTVNPNTHQVLLTNIPRDSYVTIPGFNQKDKLTHAGIYGIEKSIATVENILDIDINYYVKVNFTSLEEIVDALGGITVYSEYSFTSYIDNYYFKKGYVEMNGNQALAFSRERKSFAEGDIMRGKNQQAVIDGIIRKATSPAIIYRYNSLLNALNGKFQTSLSSDEILELIKFQLKDNPSWNVTSITLSGVGSSEYTYSAGNQKLSVLILDDFTISNAKALIKDVFNGKKLENSYDKVTTSTTPIKQNIVNNYEKEEKKDEEKIVESNDEKKVDKDINTNIIQKDETNEVVDEKNDSNTENEDVSDNNIIDNENEITDEKNDIENTEIEPQIDAE